MANTKIQSEQIADSAIVADRLASDAVTTAKIADNVGLGGSPTTTTQGASDNSTKIATTAYVTSAIATVIDSAPSTLNTLNELAAALNDQANFGSTVTTSIAAKLPLAGGTMTGTLAMGANAITSTGTISSGTITSSGNLVLDAAGHNYIELHSATANTRKWRFYNGQAWNPDALLIYDVDTDATTLTIETGKLGINRGAGSLSHTLDVGGNVAITGTEIISSSRNFTNIGTISSSDITTTGLTVLKQDSLEQQLRLLATIKVDFR